MGCRGISAPAAGEPPYPLVSLGDHKVISHTYFPPYPHAAFVAFCPFINLFPPRCQTRLQSLAIPCGGATGANHVQHGAGPASPHGDPAATSPVTCQAHPACFQSFPIWSTFWIRGHVAVLFLLPKENWNTLIIVLLCSWYYLWHSLSRVPSAVDILVFAEKWFLWMKLQRTWWAFQYQCWNVAYILGRLFQYYHIYIYGSYWIYVIFLHGTFIKSSLLGGSSIMSIPLG